MECTDCRLPIDKTSHHDHGTVCCDCFDESIGVPATKRRQPRPIVKSAALFIRNRKLLVVRSKGKDVFYAVGGKPEPDETDIQCLHREVKEEIECNVTSERYYQTFVGSSSDKKSILVMICFFVELDQEPKASSEIEEILWADSQTASEILGSFMRDFIFPALKREDLVD
jgi:8-oxo-dGTP pyrophosphatase MutT (NUDIX family)